MRYVANQIQVEAFVIESVTPWPNGAVNCGLSNGDVVMATSDMTARYTPSVGDYWVVQEDGYVYLNPKDVLERNYRPIRADEEVSWLYTGTGHKVESA